jgi:RNA polymerase sigma-70 factor (ECF subfamily)
MPTTELMIETLVKLRQDPGAAPLNQQFWKLLERFRADLVQQALILLNSQEDAEDVAQETLSYAFLNLHQLREPAKVGNWLRGINRNVALNLRRKRSRAHEERLGTAEMDAIAAPGNPTTGPSSPVQSAAGVMRAVDSLPEQFREVLVLRYWEKLSNDEIADRLGIPNGTVCSRMARADRMLAKKLKSFIQQENHPK